MKKIESNQKLGLKKQTITKLQKPQMNSIKGGRETNGGCSQNGGIITANE